MDAQPEPEQPSQRETADSGVSRRRLIELRLKRIRQEASAARLEAQAVALELLLQRLDAGESISQEEWDQVGIAANDVDRLRDDDPEPGDRAPSSDPGRRSDSGPRLLDLGDLSEQTKPTVASESVSKATSTRDVTRAFGSWNDVRQAMRKGPSGGNNGDAESETMKDGAVHDVSVAKASSAKPSAGSVNPTIRLDEAHASVPKPRMRRDRTEAASSDESTIENGRGISAKQASNVEGAADTIPVPVHLEVDEDDEEAGETRRRPMAMVVSAAVHLLILFILAAFTLSNHEPKDQIAISASAVSNDEPQMESFVLESQEPVVEPNTEPTEPTEVDISPLGEVAAMEMPNTPDAVTGPPLPAMASLASSSSSAMKALSSKTDQSMEFCGVEGGGNHFVYLVDSSGSMGDAFVSARNALLQSIQMLTEKQRFYVVFFDAESDYMRISNPSTDESGSVNATTENKQRLKNWAMGISMDRGRAPYDPLRFALKLRPDVIFLLSDGEFPQGIEDLLKEENRISNLFGDDDPISIIHTIGYHSREGESRMRRIAQAHGGQYRHVPKP